MTAAAWVFAALAAALAVLDWTAVVIGSLPDGQAFREHLDIGNVRPAG